MNKTSLKELIEDELPNFDILFNDYTVKELHSYWQLNYDVNAQEKLMSDFLDKESKEEWFGDDGKILNSESDNFHNAFDKYLQTIHDDMSDSFVFDNIGINTIKKKDTWSVSITILSKGDSKRTRRGAVHNALYKLRDELLDVSAEYEK